MSDGKRIAWADDSPLTRAPGETIAANQALNDYAMMEPGERSLGNLLKRYRAQVEAGGKPPSRRSTTIEDWSRNNDWVARVARFQELELERDREVWVERQRELRERDWEQAQRIRDRVDQWIDDLPRYRQTSAEEVERDGKIYQIITIELPVKAAELAQVLKTASDIQRLASYEPTQNINLSGAALDALIERELQRLANSSQA